MRVEATVTLLLLAAHTLPAQPPHRASSHTPTAAGTDVYGQTLDGRPVRSLGSVGTRAVVLFFIASDCPISNRTMPEMRRVRDAFAGANTGTPPAAGIPSAVRFWFVYPNSTETSTGIRTHWTSFGGGAPAGQILLDPTGSVTRLAGARATPEAVVLTPTPTGWNSVYAGRVDDRYLRLGLERPQITQHVAERVIREVLSSQPVEKPTGALVGCGIVNPGADPGAGTP